MSDSHPMSEADGATGTEALAAEAGAVPQDAGDKPGAGGADAAADDATNPLAELTIHAAAARREALMSLAAADDDPLLVLDLSHTLEFDSAGVQLLLALRRTLAAAGRTLRIEPVSPVVSAVLATYHLDAHSLAPCQAH